MDADESTRGRSLMSEFSDIVQLQCSVESDKISIALNVAGLQICCTGPNKSTEQCCYILCLIAMSAGDATAFGNIEKVVDYKDDDLTRLSWM